MLTVRVLVCMVALCLVGACSDGLSTDGTDKKKAEETAGRDCGLPAPEADADPELVPAPFMLDGVEVTQTVARRKRLIVALNVPASVQDAFAQYKKALRGSEFSVLQEDNEGFEAELYLETKTDVAVLQIRASNCADHTLVFLNLPG